MSEFIALARDVDILVVFCLIYIMGISVLASAIASVLTWWEKKWDSFWKKHSPISKDSKK